MTTEATPTPAVTVDAIKSSLDPVTIPVPVTEPKPDTAPAPAAAETPKDAPAEEAAKPEDDAKRSAKTRISELYGQKKAAERMAEQSAREVHALRQQLQEMRQTTDPNDYAQTQRNDVRSAVKEERLQQVQQEAVAHANQAQELRSRGFEAKVDAAKARIPDIDQAMKDFADLPVSDYAADIISESDKAVEIALHLTKNPDLALRIAKMPPHRQGVEIARIEAKVSVTPARRTTTNAPPPVPMIGGSRAPSTPSVTDMGVEDIAKQIYGRA